MTDLHWMTATEAARAIAVRELSPVELMGALLERIGRLDPKLNVFIRLDGDAAMDAARAAEGEIMSGLPTRAVTWCAGRHQRHHRCRGAAHDLPFEGIDRQCRIG
jgi:Asp-tRNA(Asn)/Glu-tRNA(Gln) amidotransferase A subunit family amidase